MKKINFLLSVLALGSVLFTSCDKEKTGNGGIDFDTVVEDGFYVGGPATGFDQLNENLGMSAGFNEVTKELRDGMFEKYIWLEAGKDFELTFSKAQKGTRYSAELKDFDASELQDNPKEILQKGTLVIGADAPAMQVKETGLYHILLDLNTQGDLEEAQIVIAPAKWGVRGGMNGWGFTEAEMTKEGNKIIYTLENQELVADKNFKFAHCHGWKVNLDKAEKVKAEVSFGDGKNGKLLNGTNDNLSVAETGRYKITLVYEMKGGALGDSFTYTTELTEKITLQAPEHLYMTGVDFGNWSWNEGTVELTPVNGKPGHFWTIRQFTAGNGFKFNKVKEWGGDFCKMTNNKGYKEEGGNCVVEETGMYLVYIDYDADALTVEPATIYGIGNAFGDWTEEAHAFTVKDGKATITTTAAGDLRMYAGYSAKTTSAWWTREFNIYDGKIVYRGNGNDQPAVAIEAGKTITLDFNAGTAEIK